MFQSPLRASDPRPRVEHCLFREYLLLNERRYNLKMGYTLGYPASSTRNRIAKLFLAEQDADYLVMLDDDQAPTCNILDYIEHDLDVIGFPYPSIRINAPDPIPWYPSPPDPDGGIREVEFVGGGCLIIARRVLEAIPRPFEDYFDADGVFSEGEDLSFCRRVREAGFTIHLVSDRPLLHIKPVEMFTMWGYINGRTGT